MKITNEVEVCNLALLRVNQCSISSLTDPSLQAEACNRIYQQSKAYLLSQYNWTFAIDRARLVVSKDNSSSDPDSYDDGLFEYIRKFSLPAKFLRLIAVYNGLNQQLVAVTGMKPPYVIEGKYILTDQEVCKVKFIKDTDNIAEFSPQFMECFILDLAIRLTKFFNDSTTYLQQLYVDFQTQIEKAKISDCQQTMMKGIGSYPLLAEGYGF